MGSVFPPRPFRGIGPIADREDRREPVARILGGMTAYDAIVLAGGAAKRLGGADKPGIRVGGRALLDRVLAACADASTTVVVGGRHHRATGDLGVRGAPGRRTVGGARRGGPADHGGTGPGALRRSAVPRPGHGRNAPGRRRGRAAGGALCADQQGRDQPLVAVYRAEPLRRELGLLAAEHGGLSGLPLRLLTHELDLARVEADPLASFDCDTWEDIASARARIREHGSVLDEWITAVKNELGIELDVDTGVLLDLARDAAHGVARPAAPLTTFLVGYAAAKASSEEGDDGATAVAEAARKAAALALRWADENETQ